ncbi:unnamed protein product [Effrenium voratum]|nr:unnamed protein product [Effrenium voratum]
MGRFELPKWADVVKTSKSKELPPYDPDWLYVRTASMVRKIYIRKGMGVGAFRKVYGGQQRRGTCTNKFTKSSGKIARYILQQLEEMGLVEVDEEGGRMITKEGQRELDTVAVQAAAEEAPAAEVPSMQLDAAPDIREAYMIKNRDMQLRTKATLMDRMAELEGEPLSPKELNRGTFQPLVEEDGGGYDYEYDISDGNFQVTRGGLPNAALLDGGAGDEAYGDEEGEDVIEDARGQEMYAR